MAWSMVGERGALLAGADVGVGLTGFIPAADAAGPAEKTGGFPPGADESGGEGFSCGLDGDDDAGDQADGKLPAEELFALGGEQGFFPVQGVERGHGGMRLAGEVEEGDWFFPGGGGEAAGEGDDVAQGLDGNGID